MVRPPRRWAHCHDPRSRACLPLPLSSSAAGAFVRSHARELFAPGSGCDVAGGERLRGAKACLPQRRRVERAVGGRRMHEPGPGQRGGVWADCVCVSDAGDGLVCGGAGVERGIEGGLRREQAVLESAEGDAAGLAQRARRVAC